MTLLIFLAILSVLILVHEWGHFITAKKLGVNVEQFALGFGPKVFSKTYNGTSYELRPFPLGGFVKMSGDERDKCEGKPGEFFSQPVGHRALIVVMGPVINFVFAYLCFVVVFMLGHVDLLDMGLRARVGDLSPNFPAYEAGLQVGDQITAINGKEIDNWMTLQDTVASSEGETLNLKVIRDSETLSFTMQPVQEGDAWLIGVGPVFAKFGPLGALHRGGLELWRVTYMTYEALYEIFTFQRSFKQMMGPVGMYGAVDSIRSQGISLMLWFVGVISASLAIFNLLPIIPLDGGHIFLMLLEKIKGAQLPIRFEEWFARVGFAFIIMLALTVFYADFERIGLIDKAKTIFTGGSEATQPSTSEGTAHE